MKFLADMGVSPKTVKALKAEGYEAIHISEDGLFRMKDSKILKKALQEDRIVLTFDLDFADLLAAAGAILPSTIIFRLKKTVPDFVTARLLSVLSDCKNDLEAGALVTIEDGRYRLRHLPINSSI
jgi:predicted nuclease of predicted toxin-antitoxin system